MDTGRLVGMALGILALGDCGKAAAAELRITIYDQANLPPEVKQSAFDQLRLILRQSGIAIELVAGDLAADDASLFTYIGRPAEGHEPEAVCRARRDIALKISDVTPASVPATVLGISAPLALTGLNVRVYSHHIREAALRHNRPYPAVLSYAIAHEIGHVLLRSNDHDQWGLMSSVWTEREYAQMAEAGVFFTDAQSETMLRNLAGRGCRNLIQMKLHLVPDIGLDEQAKWEQHMHEATRLEQAGRYREARVAYQLALEDGEGRPSDAELRKATTWNNLALLNRYLGNYGEARQQYHKALSLFESACGPRSPEYASALHNLAVLDYQQGKLDEAIRQFRRALSIREEKLGKSDPATAQTLNSLAAVYASRGQYGDAERLCRLALTIEEEKLGPEHTQISTTLDNLASIYRRRGQFETALELSARADQIARKVYGDQHPITCVRANKIAVLQASLGRFPEALELLRRTLDVQLQVLGEDNLDVATTKANLAVVCDHQKFSEEAERFYRDALTIFERNGANNQKMVAVLSDYAWLLRRGGRKSEAKKLDVRARAISDAHKEDWGYFTVDVGDLLSRPR